MSDADPRPIDTRLIAEAFDSVASVYDRAGFSFFAPFADALVDRAAVAAGERVLDVACGTGAVAIAAARRGATVQAVDLSPGMIEQARAAIAAEDVEVEAVAGDAQRLDHPDDAFDVVTCGFGVFFLPDAGAALAEWRRVLAPGGRLALSTWSQAGDDRWAWERDLLRSYAPQVPPEVLGTMAALMGRFNTVEGITAALGDAGFGAVETVEHVVERRYERPEDWWAWTNSHGSRIVVDHLPPEAREELRTRGLAEVTRRAADGPLDRRFAALLAVART